MSDIYKWLFGERGRDAVTRPMPPVPEPLSAHINDIAATIRPIIGANVLENAPGLPTASQLGGRPWWPAGRRYPRGRDGAPLQLLVQLNFAEMPRLEPFPREGLLQLFIGTDDLMGLGSDGLEGYRRPPGFACVMHADLTLPADTEAAAKALPRVVHSPLERPLEPLALYFEPSQMVIDPTDYRFERMLPAIAADDELLEAYAEWVCDEAAPHPIRLGGYPSFTQGDPREHFKSLGDVSLLTLDSTTGIMWGDGGVAQFLVGEAALRRGDFTEVVYNWDCY
jgi:uncharacterized protein YwqG